MKRQMRLLIACSIMFSSVFSYAYIEPGHKRPGAAPTGDPINYRSDCAPATMSYDLAINNVRARLLNGGDVWWDLSDGQYIVPAVDPALGVPGVSSLFAGAVWLGGFDDAGNLKIAAQTYRNATNNDFWPGPLSSVGTTGADTCENWDRFFIVKGVDIRNHVRAVAEAEVAGIPLNCETIPESLKKYPARGNPYWSDYYDFDLPNDNQGLGAYHDYNEDMMYNPCDGDYPAIEVKGCPTESNFPDEIVFWVYNDAGNSHTNTNGRPIRMEVQVQAFAYATNDQINDMTFYRYKLINRAVLSIDSTFFGMWVDPDLGCSEDDFIGCDTSRSMMFVYNQDELDGDSGCDCTTGSTTYCDEVPALGIDYFRGPLGPDRRIDTFFIADLPLDDQDYPNVYDTIGFIGDSLIILDLDKRIELGMSSFTFHVRQGAGSWPGAMWDPQTDIEFYRYLSGSWRDGTRYSFGGSGYNLGPAQVIEYAFTGDPNNGADWSMCSASLGEMDPRTVQATGPFRLDPGAINELIIGAVWVPDQVYPCLDLNELRSADDLAQALFNNCFRLPDGPDAPDLDWIELDRELIMVLSNDPKTSNNAFELYKERGLEVPAGIEDSTYVFEGYLVYQLLNGNVTTGELGDVSKARLIFQVDIRNGIDKLFNWTTVPGPNDTDVWVPVEQIAGADAGIRHTFRITEDQFASEDRRLVNHKHYYYTAIAYAYNEFEPFNPLTLIGQRKPYLEGRGNIKTYDPLPHPQTFRKINGMYGEGPIITRLEGVGAGENFLELAEGEYDKIFNGTTGGEVTYASGAGPVRVQVFNPLIVEDGEYILELVDPIPGDTLSANTGWKFYNVETPNIVYTSEKPLANLNEQLIADLGISVFIGQSEDAGDKLDETNGTIGFSVDYQDASKPEWLTFLTDDIGGSPITNFIQTELPEYPNFFLDPDQAFSDFGPFFPFILTDFSFDEPAENPLGWNITPGWLDPSGASIQNPQFGGLLQNLNNVDIILTSDTSKWSRCVVVETGNEYYTSPNDPGIGLTTEGNKKSLQARSRPSVGKFDANADGFPDPDGAKDANGNPLTGMGWFPGYAVDVETGERVNIFFGENSAYGDFVTEGLGLPPITYDMLWNPSSLFFIETPGQFTPLNAYAGGQHYIYVTRQKYDGCANLRANVDRTGIIKARALANITWSAIPIVIEDPTISLLPLNEGLIPNDVIIKLRVDNPYQKATGNGQFNDYPAYRVKFEGVTAEALTEEGIPEALADINVVPNPYLAYSEYESSSFDNTVKITNLPAKCVVTIYSLDGRFIRQYTRNEIGKPNSPPRTLPPVAVNQIVPDLEWNLKNFAGIPIASGVYLIHVDATITINGQEVKAERVLKWFGVSRQFDPSGL
jgi:hypothetical protein